MEFKKLTAPIPSGNSILAAYGNVTTGNKMLVIVLCPLRSMLLFTDATWRFGYSNKLEDSDVYA